MKRFLAVALAASVLSGAPTARAADLLVKAPPPILPFSWTGFYAGANLGGVWDRDSFNLDPGSPYALPPFGFSDPGGLFTGTPGIVFVPRNNPAARGGDPRFWSAQLVLGRTAGGLQLAVRSIGIWA
jgi:opacity protein-like surface antigen